MARVFALINRFDSFIFYHWQSVCVWVYPTLMNANVSSMYFTGRPNRIHSIPILNWSWSCLSFIFFCLIRFVYVTECNLIMFASCVSFYLIVIVVVLLFWFNSPHLTGSVWWWWLIEWPSTVWIVARVYADPLGKRSFGICVCAWSIERNVSLCHDCCIESLHSRWWFHWPPHRQSLNLNVWFRYTACLHNNQLPWSLSGNRRTRTPTCTFAHKLIVIHNWPF